MGASGGRSEPHLYVFADLHKKNPRTFGTKAAGFLQKNVKPAVSLMTQRKPIRFYRVGSIFEFFLIL